MYFSGLKRSRQCTSVVSVLFVFVAQSIVVIMVDNHTKDNLSEFQSLCHVKRPSKRNTY